jgi:hypothetical protein
MELSGQLQIAVSLPRGQDCPKPDMQEAGWAPSEGENVSLLLLGIEYGSLGLSRYSLVTVSDSQGPGLQLLDKSARQPIFQLISA